MEMTTAATTMPTTMPTLPPSEELELAAAWGGFLAPSRESRIPNPVLWSFSRGSSRSMAPDPREMVSGLPGVAYWGFERVRAGRVGSDRG